MQRGFVYVRRFGAFVPDSARQQLRYLRDLHEPVWLHIFPEGTRFNRHKLQLLADSQAYCRRRELSRLRHLLVPRPGGMKLALDELRPALTCVYDLTFAYGLTR